jgi:hypothetical protein
LTIDDFSQAALPIDTLARALRRLRRPRSEPEQELAKVLAAHAQTIAVCEACAVTTRDLAAEVQRGGTPDPADLQATIVEAERVLRELETVRAEVDRLRARLRQA